jgi:hypothetical protein
MTAAEAVDRAYSWGQQRPAQPTITAHSAATRDDQLTPGARVTRPNTRCFCSQQW